MEVHQNGRQYLVKQHGTRGKYERQANQFAPEMLPGEDKPAYGESAVCFIKNMFRERGFS
ncbi:hypothetical protein ERIC2_c08430 [Calderihabitans maritimus]|uniref:Uncharacterized protein n=1 Tax=Calderihabitans maritimus TaxID=1246530 RepID=A0A1Z5HNT9_9FIRM|nr:hypothetical protein ERIC2_c08430 [Calderihabitans maritimus]